MIYNPNPKGVCEGTILVNMKRKGDPKGSIRDIKTATRGHRGSIKLGLSEANSDSRC